MVEIEVWSTIANNVKLVFCSSKRLLFMKIAYCWKHKVLVVLYSVIKLLINAFSIFREPSGIFQQIR
jgi:hypothetical protein